ncbi:MFS transporter [Schaalia sp. ZJ1691]|uniref:MFS transporter n=1 Tax=Schaalia sp. ZJ1691 TaxID=2709404 RepID=UPI0013ECE78B|nr:MFS transporter [Schaalia sp. ZJ1691]
MSTQARQSAHATLISAVVLLSLALLLRSPISVIPPLLRDIGKSQALDAVALGALTSVPIVCFGLLTPAGSSLLRRLGPNAGGMVCLVLIVIGAAIRSVGPAAFLFVGTVIIGFGMTLGNVVIPLLIGRDFPFRASLMTGLYTVSTNLGVAAVTIAAVPTASHVGWRWSTFLWVAIPGIIILTAWQFVFPPQIRGRGRGAHSPALPGEIHRKTQARPRSLRSVPSVVLLAVAFGAHTYAFFSLASWLPTMLEDILDMSASQAGTATSLFHVCGILGSLLPSLTFGVLRWSQRATLALVCACWLSMPLGLLCAPAIWALWCTLCGIGHGGFFTVLFTTVIEQSPSLDINRRVVSFVQSIGYIVAAIGPISIGWVHTWSGSWRIPFVILTASLTLMTVSAFIVSRRPLGLEVLDIVDRDRDPR